MSKLSADEIQKEVQKLMKERNIPYGRAFGLYTRSGGNPTQYKLNFLKRFPRKKPAARPFIFENREILPDSSVDITLGSFLSNDIFNNF